VIQVRRRTRRRHAWGPQAVPV